MAQTVPGPEVDPNRNTPLTLEHARERLRFLLAGGERNAWEIGDLLNKVEISGLVWTAGYRTTKSWVEYNVPAAKDKVSSLYRYAVVAAQYAKADVDKWGTGKLYCLMIHDGETRRFAHRGDPAEREIQLVQADGSIAVKKFRDCTCRELRLSQRRKTTLRESEPGPGDQREEQDCLQSIPAAPDQSMEFLKAQVANVARRSRKLLWPFTRA